MIICERCSLCCRAVEKDFWKKAIYLTPEKIEQLEALKQDNGGCEMLSINQDGTSSCISQEVFGKVYKPQECKTYPFDNPGSHCLKDQEEGRTFEDMEEYNKEKEEPEVAKS